MQIIKKLIKILFLYMGYKIEKMDCMPYVDGAKLEKANKFIERYREIISDPINLLIKRVPNSGYVDSGGYVTLHNGNRVDILGKYAYYSDFSEILIINRGVHEPLEEYCFQKMMENLKGNEPIMLELGSYWAHYSMWMLKVHSNANCFMVEPEKTALDCGRHNFKINGFKGEFINELVSKDHFKVDQFLIDKKFDKLDVLHVDIQGFELEMLDGAISSLLAHRIDYVLISTHSEYLHNEVVYRLGVYGYRVEISSSFDMHTTSCDGFVFASSPKLNKIFDQFFPLGRADIAKATPEMLIDSIQTSFINKSIDTHEMN